MQNYVKYLCSPKVCLILQFIRQLTYKIVEMTLEKIKTDICVYVDKSVDMVDLSEEYPPKTTNVSNGDNFASMQDVMQRYWSSQWYYVK